MQKLLLCIALIPAVLFLSCQQNRDTQVVQEPEWISLFDGKSLDGFELENSKEMIGNEIEKAVSWKGDPDLQKIMDKAVRLRFVMKDADLYSLRFK